jgi:hypothetical protein
MTSPAVETADLLDLKLLPAWLKEPAQARSYEHYTGEEQSGERPRRQPERSRKRRTSNSDKARAGVQRPTQNRGTLEGQKRRHVRGDRSPRRSASTAEAGRGHRARDRHEPRRSRDGHVPARRTLPLKVRFLPYSAAFENVVAQIKSGSVAYSLFALARLFLEKPVGYEVHVTATAEAPVYQLGDNGVLSVDREFLERNAFRFAHRVFYDTQVIETDPIKGNFSNVARCRLSGTLLGPTNHHNYQPQLRSLYEQRFSRRMSFADYQRQIEIVSDPAVVERWKEEARKITIYTTLREDAAAKFSSAAEAERHFRAHYFPGLIRSLEEVSIGGTSSRTLPDRVLNRTIEEAWAREARSPSNMMQELATRFRENSLHVFRHRRGMLFVSPIRPRSFVHEHAGVSPSVNAILQEVTATPAINRKQLLEKLMGDSANEDAEARILALVSDLRWLINEGYVIEFNDGSLDLPRGKSKPQQAAGGEGTAKSLSSRSAVGGMELALATPRALALYSPTILNERVQAPS